MNQKARNVADGAVETDALFEVLSRERRRYALYCLQRYRNPMALADLADEVARMEHDARSVAAVPEEEVKSVYMNLYHTHVPKMADAGVAEYDQDGDAVRLTHEFSTLDLEAFV
ncbi:DUF247 domain-containing protein [Halostella sp. JP-L12]|uniref:DUF7344 domain-containing protein n=1 Tax=Halostella TaxID=1843185 RepID=UPI000EF7E857|nr:MULTISPECIES: hypothetical protein [Halostella]NHN46002.1 DUF247 domain-containing protein [Halostella sp. JP-L12]